MSRIIADPNQLYGWANNLKEKKRIHDESVSGMRTEINKIAEVWKGKTSTKIVNSFNGFEKSFTSYSNRLQELIETIE